jgi:hypothetical protein
MNNAELNRAESLIKIAANNVLNRLKREHEVLTNWHYSKYSKYFEGIFDKSISTQCQKIITAAEVKPAVHRQIERDKEKRKQERKVVASELKSARSKLRMLEYKIREAEKLAEIEIREKRKAVAHKLLSGRRRLTDLKSCIENKSIEISREYTPSVKDVNDYSAIPKPTIQPSEKGENLPYASGIYFLWNGDKIEYVGQAKYICNRVRLGSHHILKEHHKISFVLINRRELTWTECYYIGITKPLLNFGRMASHYDAAA